MNDFLQTIVAVVLGGAIFNLNARTLQSYEHGRGVRGFKNSDNRVKRYGLPTREKLIMISIVAAPGLATLIVLEWLLSRVNVALYLLVWLLPLIGFMRFWMSDSRYTKKDITRTGS